jgi:hypothetical protein
LTKPFEVRFESVEIFWEVLTVTVPEVFVRPVENVYVDPPAGVVYVPLAFKKVVVPPPVVSVTPLTDVVVRVAPEMEGLVPNTADPEPVSSVNAPERLAEVNEPSDVALPDEVIAPVKFASVVTLPAVKPEAVPVMLVPTNVEGVPRFGVVNVGEVANTTLPLPVVAVMPSAPVPPDVVTIPLDVKLDNVAMFWEVLTEKVLPVRVSPVPAE